MYNDELDKSFARLDCIKLTQVSAENGDVNFDGKVDMRDALTLIDNVVNNNAYVGDVNSDGKINLLDVLCIMKSIVAK